MDNFETIVQIADWIAFPLAYFILLLLFLFFIVRPFFAYLFDWNRINALSILQEQQKEKEKVETTDSPPDFHGSEEEAMPPPPSRDKGAQQVMSKLAVNDPENAGSLVRQWLKKDMD